VIGWQTPVPVKPNVCGLLEALSVKLSVPARLPVADGVKVTPTVQVRKEVTVAPVHESAPLAKSPAFEPPTVTVERIRLAVPVLVRVTVIGALVVPIFSEPKGRGDGARLTDGAAAADPLARYAVPWEVATSKPFRPFEPVGAAEMIAESGPATKP
jgi:hypothetical protein